MEWLNTQLASWWTTSEADKSPEQGHKPTHDLQKDDTLSKDQLLAFFEAGKVQLHSQAFRQKLKDAYLLRQDLEDVITDAQKAIFEQQGIDGEYGIQFLGKVNIVYKEDNDVMSKFLQFVSLEEDALAEAEMPPEVYEQNKRLMGLAKGHAAELMDKLKDLPPEEQKVFLADQVRVLDAMRKNNVEPVSRDNTMTTSERIKFFSSTQNK